MPAIRRTALVPADDGTLPRNTELSGSQSRQTFARAGRHNTTSTVPQSEEAEDEHTLTGYGDGLPGEVIDFPPDTPAPWQQNFPQHRVRPRMQRPPMPARRPGHAHIADPLLESRNMNSRGRQSGSSRPPTNAPVRQEAHQPQRRDEPWRSNLLQPELPSPPPAPRNDRFQDVPWRTRLPPRPPIPKWPKDTDV